MADPDGHIRLFVGVRISVAAAEAIAGAARALHEPIRDEGLSPAWVPPANYHITLKFLGWTEFPMIGAIGDELRPALAGATAFEIENAGLGAFPTQRRARVLWAGARDPGGRIADLAARVDATAERLGFPAEARPFHPHVTMARLRRPGNITSLLEDSSEQEFSKSWIDSVVVFESKMKSKGSEYVERAIFPLEAPGSKGERQT